MRPLTVSGRDCEAFLQGQTTCNVSTVSEQRCGPGALCNPKGRVIATFTLWRPSDDSFCLLLPAPLLERVQTTLQRYVLRSDVRIDLPGEHWSLFGLSGQRLQSEVDRDTLDLSGPIESVHQRKETTVIRMPGRQPRFIVMVRRDRAPALHQKLNRATSFDQADSSRWLSDDIEEGIPCLAEATTERFVPQMLNLDMLGAISFEKGCYTGQEVVARTHYLGTSKRRMYRLAAKHGQVPQPGAPVYTTADRADRKVGTVVIAAPLAAAGFHCLAVLDTASAKSDTLRIDTAAGEAPELQPLPYALQPLDG